MLWVLQSNIFKEINYINLISFLDKMEIPCQIVNYFDGEIDPDINVGPDERVMFIGTLGLHRVAQKKQWKPGSFLTQGFDAQWWTSFFEYKMLNNEPIYTKFKNIPSFERYIREEWGGQCFARPTEDNKYFDGKVYTISDLIIFHNDIMNGGSGFYTKLNGETSILLGEVKDIISEYRFFIVDKKIVTYSQYKLNGKLYTSVLVDQEVIDFVNEEILNFEIFGKVQTFPARAFVVDVARLSDGSLKIVEFNNFNSSGFYLCDPQKIVMAIEEMKFDA